MVLFNSTTYNKAYQTRKSIAPAVRWLDGEWRGKDDFYKCGMRYEFVERKFLNNMIYNLFNEKIENEDYSRNDAENQKWKHISQLAFFNWYFFNNV